MERPPKFTLLDETGHPFGAHIQAALTSLTPRLLRHYPALRDESLLIGTLETAARKITNRERESGPIAKLHGYAWVTVQRVATSQLRQGRGRLAQKLLESEMKGVSLDGVPARTGTADEIERAVLWREVLARLSTEERRVCIWKKAGYTSDEIAEYRGGTASAVDTLLSRAREKIRRLLGGEPGDAGRERNGLADKNQPRTVQRGGVDDESPDGD